MTYLVPKLTLHPGQRLSYHQAFLTYANIDVEADIESIRTHALAASAAAPTGITSKDTWLDWLMGECVAAKFPTDRLTFIYDYPASQAALAHASNPANQPLLSDLKCIGGRLS